jgi:hypothetical protein
MHTQYYVKSAIVIASILLSFSAFAKEQIAEIIFEGDTLEGELLNPNGERIEGLLDDEHMSLIQVRSDFVDQVIQSVNEL